MAPTYAYVQLQLKLSHKYMKLTWVNELCSVSVRNKSGLVSVHTLVTQSYQVGVITGKHQDWSSPGCMYALHTFVCVCMNCITHDHTPSLQELQLQHSDPLTIMYGGATFNLPQSSTFNVGEPDHSHPRFKAVYSSVTHTIVFDIGHLSRFDVDAHTDAWSCCSQHGMRIPT